MYTCNASELLCTSDLLLEMVLYKFAIVITCQSMYTSFITFASSCIGFPVASVTLLSLNC